MAFPVRTSFLAATLAALALPAPLAAQETAVSQPAVSQRPGAAVSAQLSTAGTAPPALALPISVGAFLGADYFGDQIELGNAYPSDEIPGSAAILGLRGAYVLLPHLAPGARLDPSLSVEAELKFAASSTLGDTMSGRTSRFAPVFGWRAHALLDLFPSQKLSPFVLVGVGGETVVSSSPFIASPDTDAAMHWGVGVRYDLSPRYGLRFDARQAVTAGRTEWATFTYEAHVGVYFRFGLHRSHAAKRIAEVKPKPAPKPVEKPPADSDGDGIPDSVDRCPHQPEDKDGFQDADGCPDPDNDNDGIVDSKDKCPNAAEDKDGFQDADGCPDPDNDGDHILDVVDACPNKPETYNGYEDSDGCPDTVPKAVARFTGTIRGIYFRTGSARIRPRSRHTLNAAVKVFRVHPSVRIEISGYTDSRGSRQFNMRLSRKRADAVKWYLVDHGIDQNRITSIGYGPDRPVADNATARGRAKNRRIEFHLISAGPPATGSKRAGKAKAKKGKPAAGARSKVKGIQGAKRKPAGAKGIQGAKRKPATAKARPGAKAKPAHSKAKAAHSKAKAAHSKPPHSKAAHAKPAKTGT